MKYIILAYNLRNNNVHFAKSRVGGGIIPFWYWSIDKPDGFLLKDALFIQKHCLIAEGYNLSNRYIISTQE